jgi:hypothetical protein
VLLVWAGLGLDLLLNGLGPKIKLENVEPGIVLN